MPKQSVKEMGEYLKMSDLVCYINDQYITGLKELFMNEGAVYFIKLVFAPTKANMDLIKKEELKVKVSCGKKVIFNDTVSVASVDLFSDEGDLIVCLETVLVDNPFED